VYFLNKNIDRDIEGQRANLGKSENLLSANMKQFGNLRDATDMTKVMQMDIVKNQIAQAAATAQGPLAQARAQQAIGQIDQQIAPIMSQMAMRKSLLSAAPGQESQADMDPSMKIRALSMSGFIPKEQVEPMMKQLQSAEDMSKQKDNVMGVFDKLSQINTVGNRITSPIQTSKQVNALRESELGKLVKESEGRITPTDVEMLRGLFPAPGDSQETSMMKRNQMNKFLSEKMNFPQLKAYGISPGASRFASSGEKKIQLGAPKLQGK
jgi:hypothetical protein